MNGLIFEQFCTRLVLTLGHFLWQGAAIALLAWLAAAAMRGRAERFRYSVFLAALMMMPLGAVITASLVNVPASSRGDSINPDSRLAATFGREIEPPRRTDAHVRPAPSVVPAPPRTDVGICAEEQRSWSPGSVEHFGTEDVDFAAAQLDGQADLHAAVAAADETASLKADSTTSASSLRPLELWLCVFYAGGVSLMLLRLAFGLRGGSRLRQLASHVHEPELLQCLARQVKNIGLRSRPALAWCGQVAVPTVIGVLRPIILMPAGFATGLTLRQLEALLAHELVHIRRWDPAVNILQRLVEAAFFFHPAVWFISKQIRNERENCTDDAVVSLGFPSVEYAKALLQAAELAVFGRTPEADLIAIQAGESPSQLTRRVRRLLNSREHEIFALSRLGSLALLLAIAASVAVAGSAGLTGSDSEADPEAAVTRETPREDESPQEKSKEKPKEKNSEKPEAEAVAGSKENQSDKSAEVTVKGEIHDGIFYRTFDLTRSQDKSRPHTRVVLPNGVEFTILGITTFPHDDGDDWWLPTGEALPGKPVHFVAPAYEGNPKKERRAVLVKVDNMPPWVTANRKWPDGAERGAKSSPEREMFLLSPTFAHVVEVEKPGIKERYRQASLKIARKDLELAQTANQNVPGTVPQTEIDRLKRQVQQAKQEYEQAQRDGKLNQESAELTFRFPGGPWKAEALFERQKPEDDSQPAEFKQIAEGLGPRGDISIDPPRRPDYGATIDPTSQVRVRYDGTPRDGEEFSMRAVAINLAGQRIMPTGHSSSPRDGESQVDFFFPMRPEEIQEVSIESLQFANSVTFSGLAVEAGQPAKPQVRISAPAVSEAGEFAYGVSKKIESRVEFTDPMVGIRTQREFAELLNRYAPDKPDGAFQTAFMTALNRHLNRVWPQSRMRDSFAWDDIHLFQLQRVRNLQWLLFQYLTRQNLSERDAKNLSLQLESTRNRIVKAATGDHRDKRVKWLAEFDALLTDPLFPCFRKPLTVEQHVEFVDSLDDLSSPFSVGRMVEAWAAAQFQSSQDGTRKPEFELSTFREPVWRFARNEKTSELTAEYFSAARQSGVEVLLESIEKNGAFLELQSGLAGEASGGEKLASSFTAGGEQATADWFADQTAGAFYLDTRQNRLIGVRGTKFLPLTTRYWQETDLIPTAHIVQAVEKSGRIVWQYQDAASPTTRETARVAVQTADGRTYVAALTRPGNGMAIRVRPHDTPTPESGPIPESAARLIVQGEIADVDSPIGRRFVREISDREYNAELNTRVEQFVEQLRKGDGTAADFMTPGVSPRTIRSWEWWGDAGAVEVQNEWKRLRGEVAEGKFRVGEGGFGRLRFWPDFGFNVVLSGNRGYFRLIGVDATGQQWQRIFLLERISSVAPQGLNGWAITGYTQGRMATEDFLLDSPALSLDWKETQKFSATPLQVESGNFYLDLESGSRFTQPSEKATANWIRNGGIDLRFGSKSLKPGSSGVDLFGTTVVSPGASFSQLSPGSALHLLGKKSPSDTSVTGIQLVRTRSGGVFVLQTRSREDGGQDVLVRELSREKLASRVTIEGLDNPGPEVDLPTGTDWQQGKYGIEYRIRQEKKSWRLGEHPLVFVDIRSDGRTERLAVPTPQFQHYIDYDGGRYSRSVGGTYQEIPTEGHVTVPFVLSPLWQREPLKDPMPLEPGRHAFKAHIRIGTLPLYDDEGNIVRPPGEQFRPEPIPTVPIAIVISEEDVRRNSKVRAENIRRELIGLTEFHTSMEVPHTLQGMIAEHLPESADVLLALCESDDEELAKRASTVLVRFLDDLTDPQTKRYFDGGFAHFAEKRDHYPQGIDAMIGLGYRFNFGHEGLPKDRKYQFQTTTRHFLDGKEFGEKPYNYPGPGAASEYVKLKDLEVGEHVIRMTTEWEFTRGERHLKGSFETDDLKFEITPADTPNDLIAKPDPDLAKIIQEAFQFRESDTSFQRRPQFRPYDPQRAWRPNTYTVSKDGTGPAYALHTPSWRMNRLLPVDLAFRMKMTVEGTDLEIPCYDAVILAGERTHTRHVYTSGKLGELVKKLLEHADENGFVKVRFILTPSREVALQNPTIKKYFPGSITSDVLRLRASTSTEVPLNLPPPDPKYQTDDDNS